MLGAFQSGYFPGLFTSYKGAIYFLTYWYPQKYITFRIGIFFCSSMLSGIAGGVFSYVISSTLNMVYGIEGWRWIFILEGVPTVLFGILCLFTLPDYPHSCKFLNTAQKKAVAKGINRRQTLKTGVRNPRMVLLSKPSTYVFCVIFFCLLTSIYCFAFAFPSILLAMGYTSLNAQLLSCPPFLLALIAILVAGKLSDKYDAGFAVLIVNCILSGGGFLGMMLAESVQLKYLFSFIACVGCNVTISPFLSWLTKTAKGSSTAAGFLTGLVISFGNLGGFLNGFLYPKSGGQHQYLGNGVNAVFSVIGLLGCILLRWLLSKNM